jgi:hypothetical protein
VLNILFNLQFKAEETPICDNDTTDFKSISYENIVLAFVLLPAGFLFSVVVLIIEKWKKMQ